MSTRNTLKHCRVYDSGDGFHLYEDDTDEPDSNVVHLELCGVEFDASIHQNGGNIDVAIPREWAVKLGLLPTI